MSFVEALRHARGPARRFIARYVLILLLIKMIAWADLLLGTRGHVAVLANHLLSGLLFPLPLMTWWAGHLFVHQPWLYYVFLAAAVLYQIAAVFSYFVGIALGTRSPLLGVRGLVVGWLVAGTVLAAYFYWKEQRLLKHDLGLSELPHFVAIHEQGGEVWTDVMCFYDCRILPRDLPRLLPGRPFEQDEQLLRDETSETNWLVHHKPFVVHKRWSWKSGKANGWVSINAQTNRAVVVYLAD